MATDNQLEEIRQRRASVKPFQKNEAPSLYNAALADIDYLLAEIDRLKGENKYLAENQDPDPDGEHYDRSHWR